VWALYLRAAGLPPETTGGRVIAGEQSNTSVILPAVRPAGAPHGTMLKILRTVAAGAHPDVVVPQALTAAGFTGTPRYLGAVELPEAHRAQHTRSHLAVAAALVPDANDGFELACAHARDSPPFDTLAADLGAVVAHLHAALRESLPVSAHLDPTAFVAGLQRRADAALDAAPALAPHATAIRQVLADLQERLTALPLQRIHGDLHLGQALHGTGLESTGLDDTGLDGIGGWQLLDFEGEPQRPVAERAAPDLPVRDVAGMLRSFDYAAAVGGAADPAWAAGAQQAFLDGYRAAATVDDGTDAVDDAVLRALVLDKALYEVVYETRQRPHWVHIPLAAVERIAGGASV
jgi:maltokinase